MAKNTRHNLANPDIWIRLLYMIVFGVLLAVARLVIWVVAVLQFLLVLFSGSDNTNLRNLGQGTSRWALQAFLYVTFNSEDKPFPFSDWPQVEQAPAPDYHADNDETATGETTAGPDSAEDSDVPSFVEEAGDESDKTPDKPRD